MGAVLNSDSVQKENPRLRKLGTLFALSGLANAAWLFTWHYNYFGLSVLVMLTLLGLLIASYLKLNVNRSSASGAEWWSVDLPFSVYLGWITIATIANLTALLVNVNWNTWGLGEQFWAVAVIIVGIAIALSVLFTRKDIYYCLVVDWALLGILLKRLSATAPAQSVVVITIVGLVLITAGVIAQLIRKRAY